MGLVAIICIIALAGFLFFDRAGSPTDGPTTADSHSGVRPPSSDHAADSKLATSSIESRRIPTKHSADTKSTKRESAESFDLFNDSMDGIENLVRSREWNPNGAELSQQQIEELRSIIESGRATVQAFHKSMINMQRSIVERAIADGSLLPQTGSVTIPRAGEDGLIGASMCVGDKTWAMNFNKKEHPYVFDMRDSMQTASRELESNVKSFFIRATPSPINARNAK